MACIQVQKMLPPGVAHTNDFPGRYFKTDLVGDFTPGSPARSFETNAFKECSNIRDARAFKVV